MPHNLLEVTESVVAIQRSLAVSGGWHKRQPSISVRCIVDLFEDVLGASQTTKQCHLGYKLYHFINYKNYAFFYQNCFCDPEFQ